MRTRFSGGDKGMLADNRALDHCGPMRTCSPPGLQPVFALSLVGAAAVPGGLTFSRASNATMFNAAGQRVWAPANLLLRTDDFSHGVWTKTRASIGAASPLPVGNSFAFVEDTTAVNTHSMLQSVTFIQGVTYSFSVYAKSTGRNLALQLPTASFSAVTGPAYFDLSAGTVLAAGGAVAEIFSLGSGVYRIAVTAVCKLAGAANCIMYLAQAGNNSYTGDGVSGVTLSAAQVEYRSVSGLGVWNSTSASIYYGPRFDYNPSTLALRGLLMEGQAVNAIKNSEMAGASVGVHPTGWTAGSSSGIATSITGTGIEDGMPYVDVRWSGTASAAGVTNLEFQISTDVAAVVGQVWCGSVYLRKIAGTDPTGSKNLQLIEGNPSFLGLFVTPLSANWNAVSVRLNRPYVANTLVTVGTTHVRLTVALGFALSEVVDITLRIACPQLEGGGGTASAYAPSSPVPTYGVSATRGADACAGAASFWNPVEGAVFCEFETPMANAAAFVPSVCFSDGTAANRTHMSCVLTATPTCGAVMHSVTASAPADVNVGTTLVAGQVIRGAYRYRLNDWAVVTAGGTPVGDATALVPVGVNTLTLAVSNPTTPPTMIRWLREIKYYNTGLSNAQLQAITA